MEDATKILDGLPLEELNEAFDLKGDLLSQVLEEGAGPEFDSITLEKLSGRLLEWVHRKESFWETLSAQIDPHEPKLLLAAILTKFPSELEGVKAFESVAIACSCYWTLLCIPGAAAHGMYDQRAVTCSLSSFGLLDLNNDSDLPKWGNLVKEFGRFLTNGVSLAEDEDLKQSIVTKLSACVHSVATRRPFVSARYCKIMTGTFDLLGLLWAERHGDPLQNARMFFKAEVLPSLLMSEFINASRPPAYAKAVRKTMIKHVIGAFKAVPALLPAVEALLQHLALQAPLKADWRRLAVESVVLLADSLPNSAKSRFLHFLQRFCRLKKPSMRVTAVQLLSKVLLFSSLWQDIVEESEEEGEAAVEVDVTMMQNVSLFPVLEMTLPGVHSLLQALLARLTDIHGSVRVVALQGIAETAAAANKDQDGELWKALMELMPAEESDTAMMPPPSAIGGNSRQKSSDEETTVGGPILGAVRLTLGDEKPNMRRVAVQTYESLLTVFPASSLSSMDIAVLEKLSMAEGSVLTRRQAIGTISSLMQRDPARPILQTTWKNAVLPALCDASPAVLAKAISSLEVNLLGPLTAGVKGGGSGASCGFHTLPAHIKCIWGLLSSLTIEQCRCLREGISLVKKKGSLKEKKLVTILTSCANALDEESEERTAVWILLESLSQHEALPPVSFITDHWERWLETWRAAPLLKHGLQGVRILEVIKLSAGVFPPTSAASIAKECVGLLKDLRPFPALVQSLVGTLYRLCLSQSSTPEEAISMNRSWGNDVLTACDAALEQSVARIKRSKGQCCRSLLMTRDASAPLGEAQCRAVTASLYTIGAAAMMGIDTEDEIRGDSGQAIELVVRPELQTLVQTYLSSEIFVGVGRPGVPLDTDIRGHALLALGKICLRDVKLAQKFAPVLVKETLSGDCRTLRNNALLVLGDLCRRFPAMVDRYFAKMATAVVDPEPLVRDSALHLLARLVSEDYMKLRGGLLFLWFARALADPVLKIGQRAIDVLSAVLLQKRPTLHVQRFVDLLFVLNDVRSHTGFNRVFTSGEGVGSETNTAATDEVLTQQSSQLALPGKGNHIKRQSVYRSLLLLMSDEERFKVRMNVSLKVLGAVVDEEMAFPTTTHPSEEESRVECLLIDAFSVLSCKEMKLSCRQRGAVDGDEDEVVEDEPSLGNQSMRQALRKAKGALLSTLQKRSMVEAVLPVLLSLRQKLQKHKSTLMGPFMGYLKDIFTEYASDVKEMLAGDAQLAKEVEYDLRLFAQQQRKQQQRSRTKSKRKRSSMTPAARGKRGRAAMFSKPAGEPSIVSPATPLPPRTPMMSPQLRTPSGSLFVATALRVRPPSSGGSVGRAFTFGEEAELVPPSAELPMRNRRQKRAREEEAAVEEEVVMEEEPKKKKRRTRRKNKESDEE